MPNTSPIQHVVVLTLENRSFDHMLGYLPRRGHLATLEGLTGNEFNLLDPSNASSKRFATRRGAAYEFYGSIPDGPGHSFDAATVQLTGSDDVPDAAHPARQNGYVRSFGQTLGAGASNAQLQAVMDAFTPDQVPAISTLAQEFVVCDHWFSSVPGPTMPNRLYMHGATSDGYAYNQWGGPFGFKPIYESLTEAQKTWRIYYANDNVATHFTGITHDRDHMRLFDSSFVADVGAGDLPNYSFIVPRFIAWDGGEAGVNAANSEHAPGDVAQGERLIATVYDAIRANDDLWRSTLLVVVFDEHGGFYDHVIPPTGVPNPDGKNSPQPGQRPDAPTFDFTRLGVRVPAILVSPWLPKGVDHTVYEHSSIPATLKRHFGLADFLTARDAAANAFDGHLRGDLVFRDDTPVTLPVPTPMATGAECAARPLDSIQADIVSGVIQKERDPAKRADLEVRVAAGMTQHEAAEVVHEVNERFLDAAEANGGRHPDL